MSKEQEVSSEQRQNPLLQENADLKSSLEKSEKARELLLKRILEEAQYVDGFDDVLREHDEIMKKGE